MKRIALALLAALVLSLPSAAHGQDLYLNIGGSLPSSPSEFADNWRTGTNLGVAFGFPVNDRVEVVLSGAYHQFDLDSESFSQTALEEAGVSVPSGILFGVSGGALSITSAVLLFKYGFPTEGSIAPYVMAGPGVYKGRLDDLNVSALSTDSYFSAQVSGDSEVNLGGAIGAGVMFPRTSRVQVFVDARYSVIFSEMEKTHFLPLRVGVRLTPEE